MDKRAARPGLFEEDIKIYHATKAVSSSNLREFMRSPKKFMYNWESVSKEEREPNDAFSIGSALHGIVLEPGKFNDEFVVAPEINKRTKSGREEWDAFKLQNIGKTLLTLEQLTIVKGMHESIQGDEMARELLKDTVPEMSARVMLSNDLLVQCRPDAMKAHHIIDVKTCNDVNKFQWEVKSYGYHLQAAFYHFILSSIMPKEYGESNFYFIVVEKSAPYEVRHFAIDNDTLSRITNEEIKPSLLKLKRYLDHGKDTDGPLQEIQWLNIM